MSDRMPASWRPANYGGSVEGPQSAALAFVAWVIGGIPCIRCRAEWVARNLPRSAGLFGIDADMAGPHNTSTCPQRHFRPLSFVNADYERQVIPRRSRSESQSTSSQRGFQAS